MYARAGSLRCYNVHMHVMHTRARRCGTQSRPISAPPPRRSPCGSGPAARRPHRSRWRPARHGPSPRCRTQPERRSSARVAAHGWRVRGACKERQQLHGASKVLTRSPSRKKRKPPLWMAVWWTKTVEGGESKGRIGGTHETSVPRCTHPPLVPPARCTPCTPSEAAHDAALTVLALGVVHGHEAVALVHVEPLDGAWVAAATGAPDTPSKA